MRSDQERARWLLKSLLSEINLPHCEFTAWEEKFITDNAERLEKYPDYLFTPKQLSCMEKIYRDRNN